MVEGEFVTFAVLFEGITTTSMQLLHVTNQGFMPRARNLKKQFSLVFESYEVETTHRWHTVSNLVHHGWNSLNCCEQTNFNYEKAQQGNFKCNYLHLVSLQV